MKIALISLARRGGMVHFQAELANALANITPTVAVCSAAASPSYFSNAVSRLTVDTGRGAISSFLMAMNPRSWFGLARVLMISKIDIVHITANHEWNPILAVMIKLVGKPLVYTVHDPEPHIGAPFALRISDALVSRVADAIVVLTENGRARLRLKGVAEQKIRVIPHGVYSFFEQWRHRRIRAEKKILYFGRIEPYKGLNILLAAFARIRGVLADWKLVIAGSGDISGALRDSSVERIELLNGYIADEEVANLMQRAQMVVIPYSEATQSGVIATAYAFGRPVIATDVGGLNEMVIHDKSGLLIAPNNVDALAQAIKTLASDTRRLRQMGRYAYTMSHRKWGWDEIAQKHCELYSSLHARRRIR